MGAPKGRIPWNKGLKIGHWSGEVREKVSNGLKSFYMANKSSWCGRTHSLETKNKMSKAWEKRRLIGVSDETRQKLRITPSIETRTKMSLTHKKRWRNGLGNGGTIKGHFWSEKNNRIIHFRSSWEYYAFQLLEKMKMVKAYEVEPFSIAYRCGYNNVKSYIPDILIHYQNELSELVEIKPKKFVKNEVVLRKAKAARQFCNLNNMNFSIWTEDEIFKHKLRTPYVQ